MGRAAATASAKVAAEVDAMELDERALAKLLRTDATTVHRYRRQGIIRQCAPRRYNLSDCVGNMIDHLRQIAGRQGSKEAMAAGAALKQAQRRVAELKAAALDGTLLSMPEIEAHWSDLIQQTKWLILSIPAKARTECGLTGEQETALKKLCAAMLREVAAAGQVQVAERKEDADVDDE